MSELNDSPPPASVTPPVSDAKPAVPLARPRNPWFGIRKSISTIQSVVLGTSCVFICIAIWWFITRGEAESRIVGPLTLPSPEETFRGFRELWFDFELTRNLFLTLKRVGIGFLLAMAVGIPLGVLAGCFSRLAAFLSPLVMFGRNTPLAAVLQLMVLFFGTGESNKIMFIFFASVAFVFSDAARAIMDVDTRYIDTAYTLGANRWQTIMKVLVPLAAPSIFSSCRQMFGLAFGYIMLVESIKESNDVGGLGYQIAMFQRRHFSEQLYLIILIIPLVALVIDQILFWIQRQLFPHVYGGDGLLRDALRFVLNIWEDFKGLIFKPKLANLEAVVTSESKP